MSLETLASEWTQAKIEELAARDRRLALEQRMLEGVELPTEGTKRFDAGPHVVVVRCELDRKLDAERWAQVEHEIPEDRRPVELKPQLVMKGVRWLADHDPENYARLCRAMTTKPAKPSFKVEPA